MIVTADEVRSSFRGTVDLLNRRTEGLKAFDMSEAGFWRSFAAIGLTLPSYVVSLAFERRRLGFAHESFIFNSLWLDLAVALAHALNFVALPLAMIVVARKLGLGHRYVPFVIVLNWINVIGLMVLAVPATLLLVGWATPQLAGLFTIAFMVVILRLQWFTAKLTLGVSGLLALGIVGLGVGLNLGVGHALRALIG